MNVTIIGTGKMARGISTRLLEGGNNVALIGHTPGKAEALAEELKGIGKNGRISVASDGKITGDVVVLAVPYGAAESTVQLYRNQLIGKILVDITNPVNYQTMESVVPGSSAAEQLARLVLDSTRVVKAFNTVFASTLITGQVGGMPLDIFLAGDDAEAKAKVTQLVEGGGLRAIDTGPLVRARQLEALALLHMAMQSTRNTGYKSSIKIIT